MSLVLTLMQPLRTQYQGTLDKNELRPSRYGAWDFYKQDSARAGGVIDADMRAKIKASFGNSVVVPVIDSRTVTIGNVRSCTIADDENTSKLVTITFVTYAFAFTMYPAQYYNNDIKYQTDFTTKMKLYTNKLAATLDSAAIANLEANKNTFWTGVSGNPYTQSGDALQVSQAQKNDYYNNLESIMATMDYYGPLHIVSSTSGAPLVRRLAEQGAANSTNEQWQITPYDFHFTNRIPNAGGIQSTQYVVQEGSVGVETRVDPDALAGHAIGTQMKWDKVNVPLPGGSSIEMGSFYREDCSDASALQTGTSGLTRTKREGWEFSVDVAFVNTYSSAPSSQYRPILKTEISAT